MGAGLVTPGAAASAEPTSRRAPQIMTQSGAADVRARPSNRSARTAAPATASLSDALAGILDLPSAIARLAATAPRFAGLDGGRRPRRVRRRAADRHGAAAGDQSGRQHLAAPRLDRAAGLAVAHAAAVGRRRRWRRSPSARRRHGSSPCTASRAARCSTACSCCRWRCRPTSSPTATWSCSTTPGRCRRTCGTRSASPAPATIGFRKCARSAAPSSCCRRCSIRTST